MVVTADGVMGTISEKAGIEINKVDLWYASILAYEYDNIENLEAGLYYLNGDMDFGEDAPMMFGAVGFTEVIHVMVIVLSRKKFYPAAKPIGAYVLFF